MDWNALIDAARAENDHGIEVRRGKRYTTAAIRVEIMRRHLGATVGVSTEIVHWATENGSPIVVKATVTDETGRVLATGHAEEIRGKGQVNATSALENAETSAIGRALAALGLSGGEFASANEMEGVERKREAQAEVRTLSQQAVSTAPRAEPPKDPKAIAASLIGKVEAATTKDAFDRVMALPKFDEAWDWLEKNAPAESARVKQAVEAKRASFEDADAAFGRTFMQGAA